LKRRSANEGAPHVLYNQSSTGNHWLTLTLVEHKSNRDGIGAEMRLSTPKMNQLLAVSTCGSYLSSSDKRVHFGLGTETVAQRVEILHGASGYLVGQNWELGLSPF
jgi:hypothetical protein